MPAKKLGRPKSDNPKNILLRIKVDKSLYGKLLKCCDIQQKTRSEIIRNGIERIYSEL